jgi:hypothetical protein
MIDDKVQTARVWAGGDQSVMKDGMNQSQEMSLIDVIINEGGGRYHPVDGSGRKSGRRRSVPTVREM